MADKRQVEGLSGFCRFPGAGDGGHRHCSWGAGIETPSAVVLCTCSCHTPPVPSPRKVLVPKK